MKEQLIIDKTNNYELDRAGQQLACTYRNAFAGTSWNERSKCVEGFSGEKPGTACDVCSNSRTEAYDIDELRGVWSQVIECENGLILVTLNNDYPVCATIAQPTNNQELYERKIYRCTADAILTTRCRSEHYCSPWNRNGRS
ncbi:MAG: hypothetical protein ACSLEY_02955 [Candidatus Saccharimonadales bacterium]